MNTQTLGTLAGQHGVDLLDHLDQEVGVPVLAGLQFQGDVAVVPLVGGSTRGIEVPAAGVPVVRGENGGNTHLHLLRGQQCRPHVRGFRPLRLPLRCSRAPPQVQVGREFDRLADLYMKGEQSRRRGDRLSLDELTTMHQLVERHERTRS